jgi:hypothetical protein
MQQPNHSVGLIFTNLAQLKGFGVSVQEICKSSLQNSTWTRTPLVAGEATVPHLDVEERGEDEVAREPRLRRGRAGQHGVRHRPRRAVPIAPSFLPTKSHSRPLSTSRVKSSSQHTKGAAFKLRRRSPARRAGARGGSSRRTPRWPTTPRRRAGTRRRRSQGAGTTRQRPRSPATVS